MNQGFKLRFDQMRQSDPTHPDGPAPEGESVYYQTGYGRNLGLVWPQGRRMFLNYAYLVAGEFEPNGDQSLIRLIFSSHLVLLQGYCLDRLFMDLLDHLPRLIVATDPRYVLDEAKTEGVVVGMIVEKKEE